MRTRKGSQGLGAAHLLLLTPTTGSLDRASPALSSFQKALCRCWRGKSRTRVPRLAACIFGSISHRRARGPPDVVAPAAHSTSLPAEEWSSRLCVAASVGGGAAGWHVAGLAATLRNAQ